MAEWLTVTPTSGENKYILNLSASTNETLSARTTYLRVYNDLYGLADYCSIEQSNREFENITLSSNGGSYESTGGTATITVNTDFPWTATTDGLTISALSGTGTTQIVITVPQNTSINTRTATATFCTQDKCVTYTATQSNRTAGTTEILYSTGQNQMMNKYQDVSQWTTAQTQAWGATLVSHTYSGGYGVLTFDNTLTGIPDYAFDVLDGANGPTKYILPSTVTYIGDYAFHCNTLLTSINIRNVTHIGNWAFKQCAFVPLSLVGSSVTYIGDSAFRQCPSNGSSINLTPFTALTYVGSYAFFDSVSDVKTLSTTTQLCTYGSYCFGCTFNNPSIETIYAYGSSTVPDSAVKNSAASRGTLYYKNTDARDSWSAAIKKSGNYQYWDTQHIFWD